MAALEYLTVNSLTAYPFKDRKRAAVANPRPVNDDWFYDIQFTSYINELRSVYISRIAKTTILGIPKVSVTFSNCEDLAEIDVVDISGDNLVNHYSNKSKSFASKSLPSIYAVKIILGPGLLELSDFSQDYLPIDTQLATAAVILRCPRVDTLTFKKYVAQRNFTGALQYTVNTVVSFNYASVIPVVSPRYNTAFESEGVNAGGLYVNPGIGAGLYDDCPTVGAITDVYSIATTLPDEKGALYLTASNCYSVNVLTENDAITLGSNDPGGFLYKYHTFQTNRTDVPLFDAVNPGHAIFLQNFCKPKCPPENLNAFAHYLNRVSDGAFELDRIATSNVETRGVGEGELSSGGAILFNAASFCTDNTFDRCTDPADDSYIVCGTEFVKYFHEFRTLQLQYDDTSLRNSFTIIEVFDNNTVRLDAIPTPTGAAIPFRILDNGVVSNMNCAANAYNATASTYTKPYFKVKYTTVESYNSEGTYVTLAAVNVAIFNPSKETVELYVSFEAQVLEQQDKFKIRTNDQVFVSDDAVVSLGCLQYAFVEAIYSIDCGVGGGQLSVKVYQTANGQAVQLGETYALPPIDGLACQDTVSGTSQTIRIAQSKPSSYYNAVTMPNSFSTAVLYGDKPDWLVYSYATMPPEVYLNTTGIPTTTENKRFNFSLRLNGGKSGGAISSVIVDYVADPVILYPLGENYTQATPLLYSRDITYTLAAPILDVRATNMNILSSSFPEDSLIFRYTVTVIGQGGVLPDGLLFDTAAGKLYGKLSTTAVTGDMQLVIGAINASSSASNTQTIYLSPVTTQPPEISFSIAAVNNNYVATGLGNYTSTAPLVGFNISDPYSNGYTLTGTLPLGLSFNNVSGAITGRLKEASSGSKTGLQIRASNGTGESNTLTFDITYVVHPSVAITYPVSGATFTIDSADVFTEASPLLTVLGRQIDGTTNNSVDCLNDDTRIKYTSLQLPDGFTLDLCSGKLYGTFAGTPAAAVTSYYPIFTATNPTGSAISAITLKITSVTAFTISFVETVVNNSYAAYSTVTYTTNTPLVSLQSDTLLDINYSLSGTLPLGLTFIPSTGKIVGKIQELTSGTANLQVYAVSSLGNSNTLSFSIAYTKYPSVAITYPVSGTTLTIDSTDEFTEAAPLLTVLGRQIDGTTDNSVNCLNDDTRIKYTSSSLPAGFTLGRCSGKLYGKYIGEFTSNSVNFPIILTATNPTGEAVSSLTLKINYTAAFQISFT